MLRKGKFYWWARWEKKYGQSPCLHKTRVRYLGRGAAGGALVELPGTSGGGTTIIPDNLRGQLTTYC